MRAVNMAANSTGACFMRDHFDARSFRAAALALERFHYRLTRT
jgi:hypothetical protein